MKCPDCDTRMIPGQIMACRTGDARQYTCQSCGAKHWQQTSLPDCDSFRDRPLREINQRLAAVSV